VIGFAVLVAIFFGYWGVVAVANHSWFFFYGSNSQAGDGGMAGISIGPGDGSTTPPSLNGASFLFGQGGASSTAQSNLTEDLANTMSGALVSSLNLSNVTSPDQVLSRLNNLRQNPGDINVQSLVKASSLNLLSSISSTDIRISADNSSAAVAAYKSQYQNIKSRSDSFMGSVSVLESALSAAVNDNNPAQLSTIASTLSSMYVDLRATPVPPSLVDLHKKSLLAFANLSLVFQAIANAANDPLRAYFAADSGMTQAINEWTDMERALSQAM